MWSKLKIRIYGTSRSCGYPFGDEDYLECSIMKGTYDGGKFMLREHV